MSRVAVVGTGIAAMGAAYFLKNDHDIVFFEKNNYPGGHTNTLTIDEEGKPVYIDSAFMVYNEITYPYLTRLFKELGVETKPTDMSFSVQHRPSGLEYCGTGINGLFAQRRNVFSARHWRLLFEMNRFNQEALEVLRDEQWHTYSLKRYVTEKKYSDDFVARFLVPISSAVWSTPPDKMLDFPAVTLVRFFKNHGFMGLRGHYQWRTVVNGSQSYRDELLKSFVGHVFLNRPIRSVRRVENQVELIDEEGQAALFDKVVLGCHADQALAILHDATPQERQMLSRFPYQQNRVTLHTDQSVMPQSRRSWSSWNYVIGDQGPSTVYWMNNLQHVSEKKNYFISVNDDGLVDPSTMLWETTYAHPLFDVDAVQAQQEMNTLNDNGLVYFCGAYFGYGFHEDGLASGIEVARKITGEPLWQ